MLKMNRKGFTLVELLVVIAILAIIASIAVPNITASLAKDREKERSSRIKLIESASELYVDKNKNSLEDNTKITIAMLIEANLVSEEEIKDPLNNQEDICGYLTYQDGKLSDFVADDNYCPNIK